MVTWWWLGLALAQDAVVEPEGQESAASDVAAETIVVYDDSRILEARRALEARLAELGWMFHHNQGDDKVYAPTGAENRWLGTAVISPDGELTFKMPVLRAVRDAQANAPMDGTPSALTQDWDWSSGGPRLGSLDAPPPTLRIGLRLVMSPEKQESARARLLEDVRSELFQLRRTVQLVRFHQDVVTALPDRLDALWLDGVPLEGDAPLQTLAARRRAMLDHWATRADTEEGDVIRSLIADYFEGVVQGSDAPLTADEIGAAEALAARPLFPVADVAPPQSAPDEP